MADDIRQKLLDIIERRGEVYFSSLPQLIPEIKGDFVILAPLSNPNVLLVQNVTEQFAALVNALIHEEGILEIEAREFLEATIDGATLYDAPVCTLKMATAKKGKKACWLPAVLKLKKKTES